MSGSESSNAKSTPAVSAIFSCLYHAERALTKQEVSKRTGLSLPTIYQGFSSLENEGLIVAGEDRSSTGGRRAKTFAITNDAVAGIGISITGHSVRTAACNLFGENIAAIDIKLPLPKTRTSASLNRAIIKAAAEATEALQERSMRPIGIGIAIPSAIDPATGCLLNTSVLKLNEQKIDSAALTHGLDLSSAVFNDANCGAFSQCFPKLENACFAYLSLERGVGGAIIIDGKPFEGPCGVSGEFGHICIEPGGKKCACGKRGCLEAYCSSNALSDDIDLTLDEFFGRLQAKDADALSILDVYIENLARGIQTIHTALGCRVALGGELASYLDPYFERICEAVAAIDPFPLGESCVLRSKHPTHAVPLGAAQLMALRYIESI